MSVKRKTEIADRVPIEEIKRRYQPGEGRHWFDPATSRFFNSRLYDGWEGPGGVYFVSSETLEDLPVRYSVRQLVGVGKIKTIGGFRFYPTREEAQVDAHCLAKYGKTWKQLADAPASE